MCYRFAIQPVIQEMCCVWKICAETWVIGYKYERVRDDGDKESGAGMRVVMK